MHVMHIEHLDVRSRGANVMTRFVYLLSNHPRGQLGLRRARGRHPRYDPTTFSQDRESVRDLDDFLEFVTDEGNAHSLRCQAPERSKKLVNFVGAEHGGGFIEQQDTGASHQGPQQFDPLSLPDG